MDSIKSETHDGWYFNVLFLFLYSSSHHIPRILGICVLTFGICGMITSLPHFMFDREDMSERLGESNSSNGRNGLCVPGLTNNDSDIQVG